MMHVVVLHHFYPEITEKCITYVNLLWLYYVTVLYFTY